MNDKDFEAGLSRALHRASEGLPENVARTAQVKRRVRGRPWLRHQAIRRVGVLVAVAGSFAAVFGLVAPQLQSLVQDSFDAASSAVPDGGSRLGGSGEADERTTSGQGQAYDNARQVPACPKSPERVGQPKPSSDQFVSDGAVSARLCDPTLLVGSGSARRGNPVVDKGVVRLVAALNMLPKADNTEIADCEHIGKFDVELVLEYPSGKQIVVSIDPSACGLVRVGDEYRRGTWTTPTDANAKPEHTVLGTFHDLLEMYGDARDR